MVNIIKRRSDGRLEPIETSNVYEIFEQIGAGSDEQIRGLFARILRDARIPATRAAQILRCKRTQYFLDMNVAFPGINPDPKATRPSRRKADPIRHRLAKRQAGEPSQ